jgi:two-component system phosphate regulon response regulator PhoB/two-component system alkaline phosphatase synthesis response regulator PhoP
MSIGRILIIEDEQTIAELVGDSLKRWGYRVETASDGDEGLAVAESTLPDLVILDLMLPGLDGWEICRRLKQNAVTRDIPVIMLTARRDERDVVAGLEIGADDYLRKPFSMSELVARVRALLRRAGRGPEVDEKTSVGPLVLDHQMESVTLRGKSLELSPTEYRLLEALVRSEGRVLSREELLAKVWGYYAGDTRTVDVHIWRLRRKIEDDPENPKLLHTLRGRGYRLHWEAEGK